MQCVLTVHVFTGVTGNVSIDANGDRNADYALLDLDPRKGEFKVTFNFINLMRYIVHV